MQHVHARTLWEPETSRQIPPQGHVLSAIPEMSVAEIRRALSKLRDIWATTTPETPLFICDKLHNDKSIAEFSKEFVFGHHLKRHYKSVTQTNLTASRKKAAAAAASAAACTAATHPLKAYGLDIGLCGERPGLETTPGPGPAAATAVPGPKGDADDPFPFASTWEPKTQRGKRAFATRHKK